MQLFLLLFEDYSAKQISTILHLDQHKKITEGILPLRYPNVRLLSKKSKGDHTASCSKTKSTGGQQKEEEFLLCAITHLSLSELLFGSQPVHPQLCGPVPWPALKQSTVHAAGAGTLLQPSKNQNKNNSESPPVKKGIVFICLTGICYADFSNVCRVL